MINKRRNVSLFALALGMALAFAACSKPKSPFEGTWRYSIPGIATFDMTFTGNEWVATIDGEAAKGTFTYTASDIIQLTTHEWDGNEWIAESGDPDTDSVPYSISGNVLTLTMSGQEMSFIKQQQP